MRLSKKNKLILLCVHLIVGILFSIQVYHHYKNRNRLRGNYKTAVGTVTGYKLASYTMRRSGGSFEYEFTVNGELYKGSNGDPNTRPKYAHLFIGRQFYVIYDPEDIENNSMMITPQDFKFYSIPFPDSLNWVKECQ
jgi:hypothetical protein